MPQRFEVRTGENGELALSGELDVAAAERFTRAVAEAHGAGGLILDLSEVTFIDSTGLRSLLAAAKDLQGRGELVLARPSQRVLEVLEIAGVLGRAPNLVVRTEGTA
jgi:anti-anti-sigma factor